MIRRISDDLLWSQIVARAWCDEGLMKRLRSDPRALLVEYGLEVPADTEVQLEEGMEVKVEETATLRRFVFPTTPPDGLTDEVLVGDVIAYCAACGGCGCRCRCY